MQIIHSIFISKYKTRENTHPHLCNTVSHGGRALFACGGGCHGSGGLHDGGGHICERGGGRGVSGHDRWYVSHQTQVSVHLYVRVALGGQLQHLQAVIIQTRDLTLKMTTLLATAHFNERLAVEDGQLPT